MRREFPRVLNGAWSSISYNTYMFQNEEHVVEHVDDAVTLQDYRLLHPMTVELSSASIRDGYLLLPGEMDPMIIYRVPTRQCRLLMSSLLESLEINDLDRVCFTAFDHTNVVVTPFGRIKLMGVRIIVLYDDALRAAQRNNYMSALQIFQSFFAGST